MLIDFIVCILLAWGAIKGLRKGFIVGVFSFLAFIIGLAAAIKLSAVAAAYITTQVNVPQRWLPVLAFLIVFLLVVFVVRLGARALEGVLRIAMLGWANKIGGMLLFCTLYLFIFSVLIFYAAQIHLVKDAATTNSIAYPFLKPLGPQIINALGYIIPPFKNMFAELLQFFEGTAHAAPKGNGAL